MPATTSGLSTSCLGPNRLREIVHIRLLALTTSVCLLCAQPSRTYRIDTVAGTVPGNEDIPAVIALLDSPAGLAVGRDGVIYVGGSSTGIRKIGRDGILSRVPGTGIVTGIAVDANNTLYSIVVLGPELYTWSATSQTTSTSRPNDGVNSPQRFTSVAVDSNNNVLIADQGVRRILRVSPTGAVTIAAGIGSRVTLNAAPNKLAVDASNNIFITQTDQRIVRLSPDGTLTIVAGNGGTGSPMVGAPATSSPFLSLGALAVTNRGEIFVVDQLSRAILKVNTLGNIESIVQSREGVTDIALDTAGNLLFLEPGPSKIWQLREDGTRTLIAGADRFGGDGGPAVTALLNSPRAVAVDSGGTLFIADTGNNRIRRVSPDGMITTVAGTGVAG